MSLFVVDASVAAKWFIPEEHGDAALDLIREGNQLHAPDFMLLEMDSIVCKWLRRGAVSLDEGMAVRDALRRYPISWHSLTAVLDTAFTLAVETGQSVYDCIYVALAVLLKGAMATADRRLYDALKGGPFGRHVAWVGDAV